MTHPSTPSGHEGSFLVTGDRVGRYEIVRPVGHGGMGEVYLAKDTLLDREVALKRVGLDLAGDTEQGRARLLEEAQRASSLSGGRIASVYDLLHEGGDQILVMEYIPGRTLREMVDDPIGIDAFWDIALQCAEALQAAHREGLVHRDIKPDNIIFTPAGSVRLIDFGIAHRFKPSQESTTRVSDLPVEEGIVGTPAYMSPEALRGRTPSRRSDVFSLGVVFHEMLAGKRPFRGDTTLSVVAQILHAEPEPLAEAAPETPPRLVAVIQRMLAKDPARRPSSAGELIEELVAARRDSNGMATERLPRVDTHHRRWPWKPLAAGLIVLAALGGVFEFNDPTYRIPLQRFFGMNLLPKKKSVAVLPAETFGDSPELAAFGAGLVDFLGRQLMHLTADSTMQVASPGLMRYFEVRDAAEARSMMGANLALQTRLQKRASGWRARLDLIDTRFGESLATRDVDATSGDVLGLTQGLLASAIDMLDMDEMSDAMPTGFGTQASGAFFVWLEGMGRLHAAEDTTGVRESMASFDLARDIDPESPLPRIGLAQAALEMHGYAGNTEWLAQAETQAREAVAIDGERPDAHLVLARVLSARNEGPEAVAEFRRVMELDPTTEDGYFQLGGYLTRKGEYDRAIAVYKEAIRARPHAWPAYWWLGSLELGLRRYDEAAEQFRRLSEVAPLNSRGYLNRGGVLVLTGHYDEGAEELRKALDLRYSGGGLSNLATAYFNQRMFDKAIRGYQDAVAEGHADYEIWGNLGDAYFWAPGKRDLARDPYERALREGRAILAHPTPEESLYLGLTMAYMANIFPKVGMPDSATVYLNRALARAPEDADVHYYAALVHWQLGDRDEALDWLVRAVQGGYPGIWIHDSPVFDTWRQEPRFQELVAPENATAPSDSRPTEGD